jgi:hypothetical protein
MVKLTAKTTFSSNMKWGALTAMAVLILSMLPQIHLWFERGAKWNGAYAVLQGDEFLYSAYVNALIDGRPRRNDPFAGRDSTPTSPLPESTFSIQFIPAFVIAWLARACGASASTAFIALIGVAGSLASLSLFWLLVSITGDSRLAAAGVMFVLCLGALAGGQGLIGLLLKPGVIFLGLPFLRRYQPAAVFPLFFVFCALFWQALNIENRRRAWLYSMLAGLTLGVLVFSYLYLWTAAVAWLACLTLLWLYLRPKEEGRRALALFSTTATIAILALIPYAYLVSHRAASLDEAQTLILTHRPDPFRAPEIIGAFILVALVMGVRRGKLKRSEPRVIFAASFALLPLVLFNQQILTGRSMQPYHFENFVANYAVLVGLVIVTALLYQPIKSRSLLRIAVLCFLWGAIEVSMPALANYRSNVAADQMVPVLLRLKELSKQDGTLSSLRDQGRAATLVFSPERDVMGLLPTWTPQGTLLGMGGLDFGSASQQERKEMFYMYLYYSAADAGRLRELLNERTDDTFTNHYARIAIFGHERVVPMLSFDLKSIQQEEIEAEVRSYQAYADSFAREKALLRPLTYVITRGESDLSHVDLWYERDAGERIGDYNLYRLMLRK